VRQACFYESHSIVQKETVSNCAQGEHILIRHDPVEETGMVLNYARANML
jgi:hypothetical protein